MPFGSKLSDDEYWNGNVKTIHSNAMYVSNDEAVTIPMQDANEEEVLAIGSNGTIESVNVAVIGSDTNGKRQVFFSRVEKISKQNVTDLFDGVLKNFEKIEKVCLANTAENTLKTNINQYFENNTSEKLNGVVINVKDSDVMLVDTESGKFIFDDSFSDEGNFGLTADAYQGLANQEWLDEMFDLEKQPPQSHSVESKQDNSTSTDNKKNNAKDTQPEIGGLPNEEVYIGKSLYMPKSKTITIHPMQAAPENGIDAIGSTNADKSVNLSVVGTDATNTRQLFFSNVEQNSEQDVTELLDGVFAKFENVKKVNLAYKTENTLKENIKEYFGNNNSKKVQNAEITWDVEKSATTLVDTKTGDFVYIDKQIDANNLFVNLEDLAEKANEYKPMQWKADFAEINSTEELIEKGRELQQNPPVESKQDKLESTGDKNKQNLDEPIHNVEDFKGKALYVSDSQAVTLTNDAIDDNVHAIGSFNAESSVNLAVIGTDENDEQLILFSHVDEKSDMDVTDLLNGVFGKFKQVDKVALANKSNSKLKTSMEDYIKSNTSKKLKDIKLNIDQESTGMLVDIENEQFIFSDAPEQASFFINTDDAAAALKGDIKPMEWHANSATIESTAQLIEQGKQPQPSDSKETKEESTEEQAKDENKLQIDDITIEDFYNSIGHQKDPLFV